MDKKHHPSPAEQAYARGFSAGTRGGRSPNPYPIDSDEFGEYLTGELDGLAEAATGGTRRGDE